MAVFEGFGDLERRAWCDEALASGYVDLFSSASDQAIPALISGLPSKARVLDLCCGQGNVSEALATAGHDVVGADFSPAMLALARARAPGIEFVEADAQDLPFEDSSFDAVVSNLGIVHIPDQPRALREVRRVLRPGGHFAMTSWCGPQVSPAFRLFYGAVREHGDPAVSLPDGPDFHLYGDEEKCRATLMEAGLKLEDLRVVECYWTLTAPDDFVKIYLEGAPRGGYLLKRQPAENYGKIAASLTASVRDGFSTGDAWRVPIPAALACATAA